MRALTFFIVLLGVRLAVAAEQLGTIPVPVIARLDVAATASLDQATGTYSYSYTIGNPTGNSGRLWFAAVDIKGQFVAPPPPAPEFTIPAGAQGNVPFDELYARRSAQASLPLATRFVPFGSLSPLGWVANLNADGTGSWYAATTDDEIAPGQSQGGFVLLSHGVPTIRTLTVRPKWVFASDGEATQSQMVRAAAIERSLRIPVNVLGPSPLYWSGFQLPLLLQQLQADASKAIQIGWITDSNLGQQVVAALQTARSTLSSEGVSYNLGVTLRQLLTQINAAGPAQLSGQARALLVLGLDKLLLDVGSPDPAAPPTPPPPVPRVSITSPVSRRQMSAIGSTVTITGHAVDASRDDAPLASFIVPVRISGGPNAGTNDSVTTDAAGNFSYSLSSKFPGVDLVSFSSTLAASQPVQARVTANPGVGDSAIVAWSGGADFVVKQFTPPEIDVSGQTVVHITDTTKNEGSVAAPASVTRFYIASTQPVNPANATELGARPVRALAVNDSDAFQGDFPLPLSFRAPGTYYLKACANGDHSVAEIDYTNNCEYAQVVVQLKRSTLDCSAAAASVPLIWPPNHKFVTETVTGVKSVANEPIAITITGILQDEPVDVIGSGNTGPDAAGVGTTTASVRAERSGTGDGRIYLISFNAATAAGSRCSGTVTVGVPHDQGAGSKPIDSGQRFDSTKIP